MSRKRINSPVNVPDEVDAEFPLELDMDLGVPETNTDLFETDMDLFETDRDRQIFETDMDLAESVSMNLETSVTMDLLQLEDDDAVFDMEIKEEEWKIDQVPLSELTLLQQRVRDMYKTVHMCKLNRLHLVPVSQASEWKEEWTTKLPCFSWQTMQDLLYADPNKPPCCNEGKCRGVASKLDSVYWSPQGSVFEGSVLSAYNGAGTPCLLCLLHQIHSTVFLFLVNRLPLRSQPPFQVFFNSDEDFHSEMLQKPDNTMFNGLVAPIMMFIHDKLVWDFDREKQQWFVNISLFRKPEVIPGVQVGIVPRESHAHLKQPKK